MKLKPSLFQLIVVLMTSTLIVSCNTSPQGSQVNCNDPNFKQSQECNPSSGRSSGSSSRSSSGSSTIVAPLQGGNSGNSTSGNDTSTGVNNSSDSNSTNKASSSKSSSRGGFGSFSSGKAGG